MATTSRGPSRNRRTRFIVRPLFAALVASGVVAPAHGANVPVTTDGDAGNGSTCTLRQAIATINAQASLDGCVATGVLGTSDQVDLTSRSGTITLAGTALVAARPMTIVGPGASTLRVSAGGASRVFEVDDTVGDLFLNGFTIASGVSTGPGGCVFSYGSAVVHLLNAVVTGCRANSDPGFPLTPYSGLGGGVFAYSVELDQSTVSGNTAQTGGGGVFGATVFLDRSVVSGNTVLGHAITIDAVSGGEAAYLAGLGGGGIAGTYIVNMKYSTVSDNTVHATTLSGVVEGEGEDPDQSIMIRLGVGGGISLFPYLFQGGGGAGLNSAAKATVAGARTLHPRAWPGKGAGVRGQAGPLGAAATKSTRRGPKADGENDALGAFASTISGNRIVGGGSNPPGALVINKYGGGGAAFYSPDQNAEFANSTISGNRIPPSGLCTIPEGEPPGNTITFACGAALLGDSAEITNSTITGNVGATAVQFKYDVDELTGGASVKAAKAFASHPKLAQALQQRVAVRQAKSAAKASMKAASPPVFDSSIIAANVGSFDVGCFEPCTIGGASNLVRTATPEVTLPGGTLSGNPQLAPLANNGGQVAGAPGAAGTGPVRTHALYTGSPAIDAGSNIESFGWDQRGEGFLRTINGTTDIGAFEGAIPRPAATATAVPALGPWMLGALSALLGALGLARRRKRS